MAAVMAYVGVVWQRAAKAFPNMVSGSKAECGGLKSGVGTLLIDFVMWGHNYNACVVDCVEIAAV